MHGLLEPGSHRAGALADDGALVAAMLAAETAWSRALAAEGVVPESAAQAVGAAAASWRPDLDALARDAEGSGNPVVPLVAGLRAVVAQADSAAAVAVHRGLTSQDVLDTALMLLARTVTEHVSRDLVSAARALGRLVDSHKGTVMVGRTLTQHAVPITFGLKAAQWLEGLLDAADRLDSARAALPVQCGGGAGTLALAAELAPGRAVALAERFAAEVGLAWPGSPWHTRRAPVTSLGDALVGVLDALGAIASDVTLLSRPEIGEVREPEAPGRGVSSTMPQKRNPVLSVLVRSAALQAPQLGAQLHLSAATAVDERPDGAWHAEWAALRRLMLLTAMASSQSAELLEGLEVDPEAMRATVVRAGHDLLAERRGAGRDAGAVPITAETTAEPDPAAYLGAADEFVEHALDRLARRVTRPDPARTLLFEAEGHGG
jgi:3-carboxy-cis,cis-muconate cycloisomerase